MPTHGLQAISGHKWDNASISELAKIRNHIFYLCSINLLLPTSQQAHKTPRTHCNENLGIK